MVASRDPGASRALRSGHHPALRASRAGRARGGCRGHTWSTLVQGRSNQWKSKQKRQRAAGCHVPPHEQSSQVVTTTSGPVVGRAEARAFLAALASGEELTRCMHELAAAVLSDERVRLATEVPKGEPQSLRHAIELAA